MVLGPFKLYPQKLLGCFGIGTLPYREAFRDPRPPGRATHPGQPGDVRLQAPPIQPFPENAQLAQLHPRPQPHGVGAMPRDQRLTARDQRLMPRDQRLMMRYQRLMARDQRLTARDQRLMTRDQRLMIRDRRFMARHQRFMARHQRLMARHQRLMARDQRSLARDQRSLACVLTSSLPTGHG